MHNKPKPTNFMQYDFYLHLGFLFLKFCNFIIFWVSCVFVNFRIDSGTNFMRYLNSYCESSPHRLNLSEWSNGFSFSHEWLWNVANGNRQQQQRISKSSKHECWKPWVDLHHEAGDARNCSWGLSGALFFCDQLKIRSSPETWNYPHCLRATEYRSQSYSSTFSSIL